MGISSGLIPKVGRPDNVIQVPQSMLDLNRSEQPDLMGSLGLPPSPSNLIPLCLRRYKIEIIFSWITVVVSKVHEEFETVKVVNLRMNRFDEDEFSVRYVYEDMNSLRYGRKGDPVWVQVQLSSRLHCVILA